MKKIWLWDYEKEDIFYSQEKNNLFQFKRKIIYASDLKEIDDYPITEKEKVYLPREYISYLSLLREKKMTKEPSILTPAQENFLKQLGHSKLVDFFFFTGGTALSEYYLKHRLSEDLDFFSQEEPPLEIIENFVVKVARELKFSSPEVRKIFNRTIVTYPEVLKVEFVFMPFENIEKPKKIGDLYVDSLVDIGVNKLHTLLERGEPKDFVDIYFITKYHKSILDLINLMRTKFDVKYRNIDIGAALLKVEDIKELPKMLKPLKVDELVTFFKETAKLLG